MAIGAVGGVPAADYVPPVGIILTMGVSTSPAELYPGTTWARIKDRFLWGASETHPLGETGGSATHTLTVNEMPAHTHSATLNETGAHSHTISILHNARSMFFDLSSEYQSGHLSGSKTVTTSSAGAHSHTVTLSSAGGGKAFSILNPYTAKNVWRRVS